MVHMMTSHVEQIVEHEFGEEAVQEFNAARFAESMSYAMQMGKGNMSVLPGKTTTTRKKDKA